MNNSYQNTIGNRWRGYFLSAYGIAVKHGFIGSEEDWLLSLTAYGIALKLGFEGTQEEWITSLKGKKGDSFKYEDFTPEQLEALKNEIAGAFFAEAEDLKKSAEEAAADAEKSKEAAEAAAGEAKIALGEAEVYVSQTSSLTTDAGNYAAEAERQKDEARSAVSEATDWARFTDERAESAAESAKSAAESAEIAKANAADIKKQCANALCGKLSGTIVRADDVSPIEHELDIKITGENIEGIKVKRFGKNLFENDVDKLEPITYYSVQNGSEITVWGYMLDLPAGTYSAQSAIKPGVADHTRFIYIRKILADGSVSNVIYISLGNSTTNQKPTFKVLEGEKAFIYDAATGTIPNQTTAKNTATENFSWENVQIELGTSATDFEPYQSIEAVADEEGNVSGLMSLSPSMTLITDNESAVIECAYNRDTNKVIEELTNAIISLGGNI